MDDWDEDNSESEEESEIQFKPPSYIIVIDTEESMFIEENGKSPFVNCLEACFVLVNASLCKLKKPPAIVFATDDTDKMDLVTFDDTLIDAYKRLREELNRNNASLKTFYASKQLNLSEFFLCLKKRFMKQTADVQKRCIVLITNNDSPVAESKDKLQVLNEIQQFPELKIQLELITFRPDFNYDVFYRELFRVGCFKLIEEYVRSSDLDVKLAFCFESDHHQRKLRFYPFKTDQTRFMKIISKNCIKEPKLISNAWVTREDLREVRKLQETELIDSVTLKTPGDTLNDCIVLNASEADRLKKYNWPVGFVLLFVNDRMSELGYVVGNSSMILSDPKETHTYFEHFWRYCYEKEKVLFCTKKVTQGGRVEFVELIPKMWKKTRCFLVNVLPTLDHFLIDSSTEVDEEEDGKKEILTEHENAVTNEFVDALTFEYNSELFPDVNYRKSVAYLKSQLLEEEMEEVDDFDINFNEDITKIILAFNDLFEEAEADQKPVRGVKRKNVNK